MAHLIIVVEAGAATVARGHSLVIDPRGGGAAFDVGLSPTGEAPATHYWVGWEASAGTERRIRQRFRALETAWRVRIYDGDQVTPAQVLKVLGLKRILLPGPGPGGS